MEAGKNIKANMGNPMKQALERRQAGHLSSNFSYRMMEQIRMEAEKQKKRRAVIAWTALVLSVLALVGLAVYFLAFYLDLSMTDYLPKMNIRQDSSLFMFYIYIALLVLGLLGLDYWLRKKYFWK